LKGFVFYRFSGLGVADCRLHTMAGWKKMALQIVLSEPSFIRLPFGLLDR
jgi:hypothetical protein